MNSDLLHAVKSRVHSYSPYVHVDTRTHLQRCVVYSSKHAPVGVYTEKDFLVCGYIGKLWLVFARCANIY